MIVCTECELYTKYLLQLKSSVILKGVDFLSISSKFIGHFIQSTYHLGALWLVYDYNLLLYTICVSLLHLSIETDHHRTSAYLDGEPI